MNAAPSTAFKPENIPAGLSTRNRWLNWRAEENKRKEGEYLKPPVKPGTRTKVDATDSANWSDFATAVKAALQRGYGVGHVPGENVVALDLDNCIDPTTGKVARWAKLIVQALASYTEVSPSGTGLRIFCFGTIPKTVKSPDFEVYGDASHYVTVTGNRAAFQGATGELTARPDDLAAIYVLALALDAKQRDKLLPLWEGGNGEHPSASEGDLAFFTYVARFCDDDDTLIRLYQLSGRNLDRDGGKGYRADYLQKTIAKARDVAFATGGTGKGRKSQATVLVGLAKADGSELFHDAEKEPYVTFPVAAHRETWRLKSKQYRDYLASRYYAEYKGTPGAQALQDAVTALAGEAVFAGKEYPVSVRLAEHQGDIYLDLADDEWRVVRVRTDGWSIRSAADLPVKFRRPKGLLPIPMPVRGGSLDPLRALFDPISGDDFMLILAWLVAALRPHGPYPILDLTGGQGSAKTTRARILRRLVDPNTVLLRGNPKEERDLAIAAKNGRVIGYDNLSHIPPWLSDALCRLATGGGFGTRTLYENDEETLFDYVRPVLFTAITEIAVRGDLLDRALTIGLPDIERYLTEEAVEAAFVAAWPGILGVLLDAITEALRGRGSVQIDNLPRMADFAVWSEAAGPALGWERGAFLAAYGKNRAVANLIAMEASPVASALCAFAETLTKGGWTGTASDLLQILTTHYACPGKTAERGWPGAPHILSGQLSRLKPNLRKVGIAVETGIRTSGGKERHIRISRIEEKTP
jgi:hypothetical protein